MDDRTPSSLNLKIIQRYDPKAQQILFTGRHVVLYKFEKDSWLRVGIEGTLFLYKGDARPNLIILNRQNMDNFSAPLEQLRDLHVEKDFLMFAHAAGTVYGLWFFLGEEMARFQELVEQLCGEQAQDAAERPSILGHLMDARSRRAQADDTNAVEALFNRLYSSGSSCDGPDTFAKTLISLLKKDPALVDKLYNEYRKFLGSKA